ncbi:MAG: FMN-binding protein [Microbacterium sp.]
MKKIVYAVLATLSGLVLLFSYRTSLEVVPPTDTARVPASAEPGSSPAKIPSSGSTLGATEPTPTPSSRTSGLNGGSYTGASVDTPYGPVKVQITVAGGGISDVQVVDYPQSSGRDQQINQFAIPQLVSETLSAQTSRIDMVSGATYTSTGYRTSLQSAIDQAAN